MNARMARNDLKYGWLDNWMNERKIGEYVISMLDREGWMDE